MSDKILTKNQLRRLRLQNNKQKKIKDIELNNTNESYENALIRIKKNIYTIENDNIKIPKTGKNGQLELVYKPDIAMKLSNLKQELKELKRNGHKYIKNNNNEDNVLNTEIKEMHDIRSNINQFSNSINLSESNISNDETKMLVDAESTGFNNKKRRKSTSSFNSNDTEDTILSYQTSQTSNLDVNEDN